MASCLMAPGHYLYQWKLLINKILVTYINSMQSLYTKPFYYIYHHNLWMTNKIGPSHSMFIIYHVFEVPSVLGGTLKCLKVMLIRMPGTFFLTGSEWYQYVFVGWFIISKQPCSSSMEMGAIFLFAFLPRLSACLKTKSRCCPSESEAIGDSLTSSLSSSRCSPMWSWPSLYLGTKKDKKGEYHKISNIRTWCTKSQNLNYSRLVLQLTLPNPFKPGFKLRMKM